MEKTFYSSNGELYSLVAETTGNFYERIFQGTNKARMTERGCSWLGVIRTYRNSNDRFYKFEISIGFNLKWLFVALLAILYFILDLFELMWRGLVWCWNKLVAFWKWIISLFKRKPREPKPEEPKEPRKPLNLKWLPWIWGLIMVILILIFWPYPKEILPMNKVVQIMPRQTAIGRAYLDGEENLLGCKFILGKKAEEYLKDKENNLTVFEEVSDASWVSQVDKFLKPEVKASLSDDQIAVITLIAMRNGEYGFKSSRFLKFVNQRKFDAAAKEIWIYDRNGRPRELNAEGKLYTWCLWALWEGHISFSELWDAEYLGYKDLDVKQLYPNDKRNDRAFKPEFREIIFGSKCDLPVVSKMKFFEGRGLQQIIAQDSITIPEEGWWNKVCRFIYPAKMWLRGLFGME